MVTGNFNSLAFFRAYYHIPASRKLAWALIVEQAQGLQKVRLGVVFCQQPHVYIDVAMRRFFTEATIGNGMLSRQGVSGPAHRAAGRVSLRDRQRTLRRLLQILYPGYLFYRGLFTRTDASGALLTGVHDLGRPGVCPARRGGLFCEKRGGVNASGVMLCGG